MKKIFILFVTLVVLGSLVLIPTTASARSGRDCPPPCTCCVPTLADEVDVGDEVSEDGHNLTGWGPIEPTTHGGGWGGIAPGTCRVTWEPPEGNPYATLKLKVPKWKKASYLELRVLDGQADDSFKLYVNNKKKYEYVGVGGSEDWVTHTIDVAGMTGYLNVKIEATGPQWSGWGTYGQLGVDWAKLYYCEPLPPLDLSDEYLVSDSFQYVYGPGSLSSKLLFMGGGVGYALSGLTGTGTGIGDNWPPDVLSQLAEHPSHPGYYTDASGFCSITLNFSNLGTHDVDVCVYMNTGFTEGGWSADSGVGDDYALDTYWQSDWTHVKAGRTAKVTLCFSNATAYNISDDPVHTGLTDGNKYPIFRLDEVSGLGFQVADFGGGPTATWVLVGCP